MPQLPVGTIIAWENLAIPSGWLVCDGTNGTPNLIGKFVMGAESDEDIGVSGGANTHIHANQATATRVDHNHGGSATAYVSGGGSVWATLGTGRGYASDGHNHSAAFPINAAGSHAHTLSSTNPASSLPTHIKRVFIKRVS